MKNLLTEFTFKNLLTRLMFIGGCCNIMIGIGAFVAHDFFLLSICLFLACCTIIGYIFSLTGKSKIGVHVMFGSYIMVFTLASFTSLASYPLMLIFPLVIGLVNLFHSSKKVKLIYVLACLFGCIICAINSHLYIYSEVYLYQLLNSLLVGVGMLFAFIITTYLHGKMALTYQEELEENKDSIVKKNKSLKEYIKSNLQLENFAYLASHELKTPIKNVSNFSQLLERKLNGRLTDKEKELFEMMRNETYRMNIMMKDLLKLSQLTTRKVNFTNISGRDFIDSFVDRKFREEREQIIIKNFPEEFYASESQLNLLFLNLLDNAFKFAKADKKALINIDCKESKTEYLFRIQDNGIGIPDDYKQRVFLIFKKLNGVVASGDSGIGLSMCKEIIERHRGEIWIEDNPNGGVVVNFTISKDLSNSVVMASDNILQVLEEVA